MMTAVSLSNFTTLEVGGAVHQFVAANTCQEALVAARGALERGWPLLVLGGGSNMLVSDDGFAGLVLHWRNRDFEVLEESAEAVHVKVGGGWIWDEWVAEAVARGWTGLECLSGIPGQVGAAPIQNVGAYGQEVGQLIRACWVLDWESGEEFRVPAEECHFGYRDSRFKQDWKGRFLVTAVEFTLRPGQPPQLRYKELQQRMEGRPQSLAEVRRVVLEIRRSKSMVYDRADPNHRSAGSFFVNPVVNSERAAALQAEFVKMPTWPAAGGQVKLSAAWLIENSGFPKGWGVGPAGLSSNHVLALINRGQARAADLLEVARQVRAGVQARFGVVLHPEPEFIGFERSVEELLS